VALMAAQEAAAAGSGRNSSIDTAPAIEAHGTTMFADSSSSSSSSSSSQLDVLQQQLDSFLLCSCDAVEMSRNSTGLKASTQQLASIFSSAAAAATDLQLRPVDSALAAGFLAWLQHLARIKQGSKPASLAAGRQMWFAAAVAQSRILLASSNADAAKLLLGAGAVPEPFLR
jgi:hypothetical protein